MREFLMSLAVDFASAWVTPWLYLEVRQVFALVLVFAVMVFASYWIVRAAQWVIRPVLARRQRMIVDREIAERRLRRGK